MAKMLPDDNDCQIGNQSGKSSRNGGTSKRAPTSPNAGSGSLRSVPPLPQPVLARLNAQLQPESSKADDSLQQQYLEELGRELRQWRLRRGYTRQALAEKLQMDVSWLLVLEQGLGQPGDITKDQLGILTAYQSEEEASRALREGMARYLATLTK